MGDYVYPSVFFSYFLFLLVTVGAVFFCVRSAKHGYWGPNGEEAKYRMLADDEEIEHGRH